MAEESKGNLWEQRCVESAQKSSPSTQAAVEEICSWLRGGLQVKELPKREIEEIADSLLDRIRDEN